MKRPALAEALDLQPHPEGGWYRETFRSAITFTPDGYDGERNVATAIYYLLEPGGTSAWHVVRSDEIWCWHGGGQLELFTGGTGDAPAGHERTLLDARQPQALVPRNTWQSARAPDDDFVLVTCFVAPGFDFADFRLATP